MENCLFCKIAKKEISAEVVYDDDNVIAIKDINPQAPVHILIFPKEHYESILTVPAGNNIIGEMHIVANRLALKFGIADSGFRLVNNCGVDGRQTVDHIHYHLLGGRSLGWPPG
ncbi:histidine triad nucleotide-binding protein [Alkalibacter rhizosphaerae]|uniref:Histidine triad nucleotide-binding protein n=1 Tax=Alkalibacter rhizosphaerae TaxID=2815577 RepID=A0A974XGV1_9FIRM|nr:histidine triad nucleotide-binding protein [Alkalibacter rhizosphaerae]QSX08390.1 histidine triad nucleotide-binding protein [Alkalibacter rhizosphaerae]